MSATRFLLSGWTWNPVVLLGGLAAFAAYGRAFGLQRRAGWLALALGALALALMSPLNALADGYLFSAHVAQHILLLLVAPALALRSLPASGSPALRPRVLGRPFAGWVAGVGSMWFWHIPSLCDAAVSLPSVRALQTVSLLVFGTMFWWGILAPREEQRLPPAGAVLYLFSACLACSVLGIILTFSPVAVCSIYTMPSMDRLGMLRLIREDWGLTPERDQQIGGLLMWLPMCLVYFAAICGQLARWFAEPAIPAAQK